MLAVGNDLETQDPSIRLGRLMPVRDEQFDAIDLVDSESVVRS
jgi:hypothetical protein